MTWRPVTAAVNPVAYSRTTPQTFHEKTDRMLSRIRQGRGRRLWHRPKIFQNLLESEIWSVVLGPGRKPHWVSFSFDSIISWHLFSRNMPI